MGFHKDDLALVITGSAAGQIVTVLGEGNIWDHTVQDDMGKTFRLDPEQMMPVTPHQAGILRHFLTTGDAVGWRRGYLADYTDGAALPRTYYPGGN